MDLEGERGGCRVPMTYMIYSCQNRAAVYVGSTATTAYRRYSWHRAALRGGRHHCAPLQQAWNSLGEESFKQVLQGTYSERQTQERVEWHQGFHGDDWKRYAELAGEAAPPAAGPEAGG
jgi:hypothetical protein